MVSAADFMRQHQAQLANAAAEQPPMADPFPALTQDPFPAAEPAAPSASASSTITAAAALGAANGSSSTADAPSAGAATKGRTQASGRAKLPDFSESAFPSLGAAVNPAKGHWANKGSTWNGSAPVIQRSVAQQTLSLSLSHDSINKLSSVMSKVQNKYRGLKVEASTTRKTGTTTFVLKAADEAVVKNAKREITVLLAKHVSTQIMIPASLRAFVIGTKGKNLKAITEQTSVKVNVPPRDPAADQAVDTDANQRNTIDYENDEQIPITLEGDEINVKQAQAMIQSIVAERTSKITQRLTHIDHIFYPFLAGPKGANAAKLEKEAGEGEISVRVPPRAAFLHSKDGDDESAEPKRERDFAIVVCGDREKVNKAVTSIEAQVEEMKNSFRTLAISIPKRQHRFLVGDAANDILASTSCSVEPAAIDDPSDSVTIRGPQTQLPLALTAAMEKANAVRVEVVDVVAAHRSLAKDPVGHSKHVLRWLNVGGKIPRSSTAQIYLPRPAIVDSTGNVHIEIVGSDDSEVSKLRETIQELVKTVPPFFVEEIDLDPLLHRFIIGRKGQGLKPYEARGVDVLFPPASSSADGDSRSDVLLVLAGSSVVSGLPADRKAREAKAKEILDAVKQDIQKAQVAAADIRTETLTVPPKLHRAILGPNGTTLNAVIGEDRLVAVKLGSSKAASPASTDKSGSSLSEDSIMVRGPSSEVERVVKELKRIALEAEQDSIINGHVVEFSVDASHVPHLVGRGGSAITKLREELGVRIDFGEPSSAERGDGAKKGKKATSSTKVVLTGRKENVEEAKKRLQTQIERLADETTVTLKIPQEMHGSFIGQGGKYVTRLQDTYAVRINFPNANAQSGVSTPTEEADDKPAGGRAAHKPDEVIIKGGKKGVEGAKAELLELLEYEKEHNNVSTFTVSTKSIARIMGKGGATIKQIRDESEAQVDVDREDNEQDGTTLIKIRGTKKAIAAARKAIESIASEVDAEEVFTLTIAPEHHGILIGPQGSNIRDLIIKAGGPEDAKASSQYVQFPRRNEKDSSTVTIRGPASLAKAIRDELKSAAEDLASRVVYGVIVAPQAQRMLIGRGGSRQSELQTQYSVRLVFPGWKEYSSTGEPINKSELAGGDDTTIVKIIGAEDRCKALAEEIKSSFASVTKSIDVSRGVHACMATPQFFRQLRSDFGVSVDTPRDSASASASIPAASAKNGAKASDARIDDDDAADAEENDFELEELSSTSGSDVVSWTLTGKDEASLQKAEKRIQASIKDAGNTSHQGKLWITPSSVPRVIGRGGSGLMNIQKESGATIEIPRDAGGLCIIRGSKDAVLLAKELIENVASSSGRA